MTEQEKTYPLFLYGTLRPGQGLWPHLKDSVRGSAYQAWAPGYRLAYSSAGDYPVMIPVDKRYWPEKKIVRGTYVRVVNDAAFQSIWNMELNAGYVAETVTVCTGVDATSLRPFQEAFAFIWEPGKYMHGDILKPDFQGNGAIVYDWASPGNLPTRIPGLEEVQSIPSQKTR
jgi:gamma-glutamylcyclotransferase (GGCT)/AIG2-like uncharacterized protein YtfP